MFFLFSQPDLLRLPVRAGSSSFDLAERRATGVRMNMTVFEPTTGDDPLRNQNTRAIEPTVNTGHVLIG